MTAYPLIEALIGLREALFAPGILDPGEKITIEIPAEAGIRFEGWIRGNPPMEVVHRGMDAFRTIDVDTHAPKRELTLHGITLRWPTGREWTPEGPRPRPLSPDMRLRRVPRYEELPG